MPLWYVIGWGIFNFVPPSFLCLSYCTRIPLPECFIAVSEKTYYFQGQDKLMGLVVINCWL